MAQWIGQFSGFTHETKVRDAEDSLRSAIAAAAASGTDRARSAMDALAERVLNARLKAVRARISALTEPGNQPDGGVARLKEKEQKLRSEGVAGILREFGVPEEPH